LVVTTIQNAEQYRLLEGSTFLAWFGMASSTWGDSVAQKSYNIRNNLTLLRRKLKKYQVEPALQGVLYDKLNVIGDIAEQIRREPMTALLHSSEGLSDVDIDALVRDRLELLWHNSPYKDARYCLKLTKANPIVHCNPDWIRRM